MSSQVEFKNLVEAQITKISDFLKVWAKFKTVKNDNDRDQMIYNLVIRFNKTGPPITMCLDQIVDASMDQEHQFLMSKLLETQNCLKSLFFQNSSTNEGFLLQELDRLWNLCESILLSSFKNQIVNDDESELQYVFSDDLSDANLFRQIEKYLLNLRQMVALLLNIFQNQIAYMVNRVIYDRELFSYEEYKAKCFAVDKNLTKMIFMKGAKLLVQDYYKQKTLFAQEKLLLTSDRVHSYLSHFAAHLPTLNKIEQLQFVHIEPLLLVFFSDLHMCVVPKEAMSQVSRTFFIDLKQNYRKPSFPQILVDVHHFFEWQDGDIRSFMHFQIMITCEMLIEEHANFTYTVLRDRNFAEKECLQKFQKELDIFNYFQIVLSTCNLKLVRYMAIRNLRECQFKQKKFCEQSDFKIERALEKRLAREQGLESIQTPQLGKNQMMRRGFSGPPANKRGRY